MEKEEKVHLKHKLYYDNRHFLRDVYKQSHSSYKLRKSLTKATIEQLKVLLNILRATSKGDIPMSRARYDKLKVTRSFKKLNSLKHEDEYRKVLAYNRTQLVTFLNFFLKLWETYLFPLFDTNHPN